jgi:uncharacterized protein YcfJ
MVDRALVLIVCAWTVTAAGIAQADSDRHHRHEHGARPHYGPVFDVARVVDVDPVWRRVRSDQPRERCWTETHYIEERRRTDRTSAALAGGVLGAAIGSQVGRGEERVATTVAGAVAGSTIGYQLARASDGDRVTHAYPVERCELISRKAHRRIEGYRVSYVYAGRRYTQVLPYDPGRRVRVRVDVRPVIVG